MTGSEQIDNYLLQLPKWQTGFISLFRKLLLEVKSDLKEEWKWNTPVWTGRKMICAASGFKAHVKFNFFHGSEFANKTELFNSGFESKQHRSIDLREGDKIDDTALKELIQVAVEFDAK